MRNWKFRLFGCLMCVIASSANASGDPMQAASAFLQLLRSEEFDSAAAQFLYPPTYTSEELRSDKEGMASVLQSLFRATGAMTKSPVMQTGVFVSVHFRLNAGSREHPLPASDAANTVAYRFAVPLELYPDASVSMDMERVEDHWKIRMVEFSLPASDPSSPGRMRTIFDHIQSGSAGSK